MGLVHGGHEHSLKSDLAKALTLRALDWWLFELSRCRRRTCEDAHTHSAPAKDGNEKIKIKELSYRCSEDTEHRILTSKLRAAW